MLSVEQQRQLQTWQSKAADFHLAEGWAAAVDRGPQSIDLYGLRTAGLRQAALADFAVELASAPPRMVAQAHDIIEGVAEAVKEGPFFILASMRHLIQTGSDSEKLLELTRATGLVHSSKKLLQVHLARGDTVEAVTLLLTDLALHFPAMRSDLISAGMLPIYTPVRGAAPCTHSALAVQAAPCSRARNAPFRCARYMCRARASWKALPSCSACCP